MIIVQRHASPRAGHSDATSYSQSSFDVSVSYSSCNDATLKSCAWPWPGLAVHVDGPPGQSAAEAAPPSHRAFRLPNAAKEREGERNVPHQAPGTAVNRKRGREGEAESADADADECEKRWPFQGWGAGRPPPCCATPSPEKPLQAETPFALVAVKSQGIRERVSLAASLLISSPRKHFTLRSAASSIDSVARPNPRCARRNPWPL